jgi:GNAT superfamily N-acetyltransferase
VRVWIGEDLIRKCNESDCQAIYSVINEAAKAYKGAIPEDRYNDPCMPMQELRSEMGEMTFFGYEKDGKLLAVAGFQQVRDVTLVRHVYVLPDHQRKGMGTELLSYIVQTASTRRILVGTWQAATWAIRFYEKNGFKLQPNKDQLLKEYWKIPERQIELSVVLGIEKTAKPQPRSWNKHNLNEKKIRIAQEKVFRPL